MRYLPIAFAAVLCGYWLEASDTKMKYPPARRSDQIDTLHGVRIEDPYRWLEDPDSAETKAWVAAENALTAGYHPRFRLGGVRVLEPPVRIFDTYTMQGVNLVASP